MNILKGVKKNVFVLGMASLFTDISSEMLYPVVPIFLTSVLGAPMYVLGLIEGLAESTASVLKAFSGWFSDVLRKRMPLVVSGYSLSALSKLILYLASSWPVVLLARFADRVGKGVRTSPRDAMIADSAEASYRGKAFGFHRAMDSVGACVGPLLAIWLLSVFKENMRVLFLAAFVPAILAVLTLVFFLRETPPAQVKTENLSFSFKRLSPSFKKFLLVSSVFAIGNSSDAFLIMRSKSLGLSVTMVIFAYVLYNVSYSLLSTPFGALSDKISRKIILAAGYIVFSAVYIGFGLASSSKIVWLLFPIYGFYIAMTDGVGKAMAADMAEADYRATALGLYHFVLGFFAFFASVIAGFLWARVGIWAPFVYGAITSFASCLMLLGLVREKRRV